MKIEIYESGRKIDGVSISVVPQMDGRLIGEAVQYHMHGKCACHGQESKDERSGKPEEIHIPLMVDGVNGIKAQIDSIIDKLKEANALADALAKKADKNE